MKKIVLMIGVSLVFIACDGDSLSEAGLTETPDLSGTWSLTGKGVQSNCPNPLDNYGYNIDVQDVWLVRALVDEQAESENTSYSLELENAPAFVSGFQGSVVGVDVMFQFTDIGIQPPVTYVFSGKAKSSSKVKGKFSASGPGACKTDSTNTAFTLRVL